MRKTYIGTGWKMNHLLGQAETYARSLRKYIQGKKVESTVFIVPPTTALDRVARILNRTEVKIGAQNMHWEEKGAYTGEVSPAMIEDCGATMIELGHSERRAYFGETDQSVNAKVLAALSHTLQPLICVGETAAEKDFGVTRETLRRQIKIALYGVTAQQSEKILLAYEPVWAIGQSGVPAEPEYANQAMLWIREAAGEMLGAEQADQIPILYGGSVNRDNAAAIFLQPHVDGLFIGRAAWEANSFIELIEIVEAVLPRKRMVYN